MSSLLEAPLTTARTLETPHDGPLRFETSSEVAALDHVVIEGKAYRRHSNGGGLVSVAAYVGDDVYVAETARIEDSPIVLGTVRVLDRAVIHGEAVVADRCRLSHDSRVGGFAVLKGMVCLRRHASVGGTARLEGAVRVDYYARITRGHLYGPLLVE